MPRVNDVHERTKQLNASIGRQLLVRAAEVLPAGYAKDVVQDFIDQPSDVDEAELQAGDLFRTLVLDEGWTVDAARQLYNAAMDVHAGTTAAGGAG